VLTTIACLLSIRHNSNFLAGLPPLFVDMLCLAIFGPTVEDTLGRARFLALYLLGGLVALGAQALIGQGSIALMLGASGAVAAVLGAYIVLYPRARVISLVFIIFFFTIVEVPAVLLLGVWLAVQLYFGFAGLAFA
jgi:membrane associated rhomboid family serine protease